MRRIIGSALFILLLLPDPPKAAAAPDTVPPALCGTLRKHSCVGKAGGISAASGGCLAQDSAAAPVEPRPAAAGRSDDTKAVAAGNDSSDPICQTLKSA